MGLLDAFRRKQITTEQSGQYFDATIAPTAGFGQSGERPTMSDLASRYGMLVHRCVTINSATAASIRPRLYVAGSPSRVMKAAGLRPKAATVEAKAMIEGRLSVKPSHSAARKAARYGTDITEIETHPFLDLLEDVNEWTEGCAWRESVYSDLQIFGRHFSLLVSDAGPPTQMWRLLPQKTTVESKEGQYVSGFKYGSGADTIQYAIDDVFWCHLFDPFDPIGGLSPLEAWLKTVDAQFNNAAFVDHMFHHGGAPDYMLIAKSGIAKEQKRAFRAEFRRLFGRMVNRKETVAIRSGDAELQPLQRPPRELQSVEHEKQMLDNLAIAFGVPKSLLTSDDVNLANAREGSITHARNTIWPMVSRFEDVINQRLLPKWSDRLFIMHDSPVQEDRAIRIQERSSQLSSGYTVNEIRIADGMPPVEDERADVPLVASSLTPAMQEDDTNDQLIEAMLSDLAIKSAEGASEEMQIAESFKHLLFGDHECNCLLHEKAADEFGDESDGDGKFADGIEKGIRMFLRGVLASMEAVNKSVEWETKDRPIRAGDNVLFFEEVDNEGLAELFGKVAKDNIGTLMMGGGSDALIQLEEQYGVSTGVAFDMNTDNAQNYLRTTERRMTRDLPKGLEDDIRNTIATHIDRGDGVGVMADRIKDRLSKDKGNWSETRAKRIARTETRFATEAGKREGWEQSQVVVGKEFLLAPGGCPVCKRIDGLTKGKVFPINGVMYGKGDSIEYDDEDGKKRRFKFNYTDVQGPPIHPNCRCTLVPKIADD